MHKNYFRLLSYLTIVLIFVVLIWLVGHRNPQSDPAFARMAGSPVQVGLPVVRNTYPFPSVFGIEFFNITVGQGIHQMVDAGAYWVRKNGLLWSDVQPVKNGPYDWNSASGLENELLLARTNDLQAILLIRSSPSWAQKVPGYPCSAIRLAYLDEFADFVYESVLRYSASPYNVTYYEIWNEPDIDPNVIPNPSGPFGCWGNASDAYYGGGHYASMLKFVHPKLKQANPDAKLLVGGLLLDCDPNNPPAGLNCTPARYLEGVLLNGGGPYFDGVSFHAYDFYNSVFQRYGNPNWHSGRWANEPNGVLKPVLVAKVQFLKNLLSSYGFSDKEFVNSEVGLLCGDKDDPPGGPGCEATDTSPFELQKVYYVAQAYAAAKAEGLLANIWYTPKGWRNSGLLYNDLSPRPAYEAYEIAYSNLRGASYVRDITEYNKMFGYEFKLPGGGRLWLLWSTDGLPRLLTLPGTATAVWDTFGTPMGTTNVTINLNTKYILWP